MNINLLTLDVIINIFSGGQDFERCLIGVLKTNRVGVFEC